MCSIEGFTAPQPFTIEQYTKLNKVRGPDDTNFFKDDQVNFGHNLLKISPNDSPSVQPYVTENGNVLTYNGEIYGLPEGTWDTKWLADRIEQKGISSLANNVNGMWAFSWYEPRKGTITLCRDHFGVKPLYYMEQFGDLFFSSTQKPLYAVLNQDNLLEIDEKKSNLFAHSDRFGIGRLTPWAHINRVCPGQIIEYSLDRKAITKLSSLWDFKKKIDMHLKWDPDEFESILVKAFNEVYDAGPNLKKTISLSGGLDSTLIASVLKNRENLSAVSCSFEDNGQKKSDTYNSYMLSESELAEQTAKEFNIPFYKSVVKEKFDTEEAYKALGTPIWDHNRIVPRYETVKKAAQQKEKVFIVGDCADELLTGYNGDFNSFYPRPSHYHNFGKEWLASRPHGLGDEYLKYSPIKVFGNDWINNVLLWRTMTQGDGFCTVADHLAGSFGMESRVPFLHQELAMYILSIPGVDKLRVPFNYKDHSMISPNNNKAVVDRREQRFWRMGNYKGVLRDHMRKFYPEHIIDRKRKIGFANPWDARDHKKNINIGKQNLLQVYNLMKQLTL